MPAAPAKVIAPRTRRRRRSEGPVLPEKVTVSADKQLVSYFFRLQQRLNSGDAELDELKHPPCRWRSALLAARAAEGRS
jgi:hypothetical protein